LDDVRVVINTLKAQSEESFAFAAQTKAALPDIQELRSTVMEAITGKSAKA
jgi:hypothetical protein